MSLYSQGKSHPDECFDPHNSSFDLAFCGNIALDTNRRLQYRSVYARLLLRHLKPTPCKGLTSDMSTGSPTLNSPAWLR